MWSTCRNYTFLISLLAFLASPASADFEAASEAYKAKNYTEAFNAFTKLARTGDARAQTVLAIMYKYGEGVPVDMSSAYDWYYKAAIQGYPPAQYNVGIMLAGGVGVAVDNQEALSWLRKARDSGYERASDKIAQITGDQSLANQPDEPIAWSKSWNLRLPNEIRDNGSTDEDGDFRAQLGAMSNINAARRLWSILQAEPGDLFAGLEPHYSESTRGNKTIYRLQVGIFQGRAQATYFCDLFKKQFRENGCMVVSAD